MSSEYSVNGRAPPDGKRRGERRSRLYKEETPFPQTFAKTFRALWSAESWIQVTNIAPQPAFSHFERKSLTRVSGDQSVLFGCFEMLIYNQIDTLPKYSPYFGKQHLFEMDGAKINIRNTQNASELFCWIVHWIFPV